VHQRIFCNGFHAGLVYLAGDCLGLFIVVG
jgi:hypothetical protein